MKAKIYVTLKKGVLDPQGKAITTSLGHIGIGGVEDVRVGKYMEVRLHDMGKEEAVRRLDPVFATLAPGAGDISSTHLGHALSVPLGLRSLSSGSCSSPIWRFTHRLATLTSS